MQLSVLARYGAAPHSGDTVGVCIGDDAIDRPRRSTTVTRERPIMAIQQAAVTITGFVAGDPVLGGTDTFPSDFRMGSTRSRQFNQSTQQWEDFATAWITVKAFRALAKIPNNRFDVAIALWWSSAQHGLSGLPSRARP